MKNYFIILFAIMLFSCKKKTEKEIPLSTDPVKLTSQVLASNLSAPWEMEDAGNGEIWFTEKGGKIKRLIIATKEVFELHTISDVVSNGEGGLLGMALHPNFKNNPFVFVVYNYKNGSSYNEKVVRFNYSNGQLNTPTVLLDNIPASSIHNGSRIIFGKDNKLYVSTGDAANPNSAQSLTSLSGKILRMEVDGSIPADNPFSNSYIYSYGHRNPQGLTMVGDKLFSSEHGPSNDDEINILQKGKNFGWPIIEGYCNTNTEIVYCLNNQIIEPIKNWTPTIAPSGMVFYDATAIPQWRNSLLLATLKGSRLVQLKLDSNQKVVESTTEFYVNQFGRLRDICITANGNVYLCTSMGTNDRIIEIKPEI